MLVEKEDGFYWQDRKLMGLKQEGHINWLIFKENHRTITGNSPSVESAKKSMVKIRETEGSKIYAHKEHIDLIKRNTNKG